MDTEIALLLSSNDAPSDEIAEKVKELLEQPLQAISEVDEEIQKLEKSLETFKEKQAQAKKTVEFLQTILSPARRIPPDILREVFFHCLHAERNPVISPSEAPLLLTQICGTWRSIALTSPRIWARLQIPFPGNVYDPFGSGTNTETIVKDQRLEQVMTERCRTVQDWLSRSGDCPLSISITYPTFHSVMADTLDTHTEALFDVLVSFARRWHELEISMPFDIYDKFQTKFTLDMVPLLRVLRASLYDRQRTGITTARHVPLFTAPALRHLSFSVMAVSWNIHQLQTPPIWGQLTGLCLHSSVGDVDVLDLLKLCPNLIRVRLTILTRWESNQSLSFDASSRGPAYLPHLESLSVNDNGSLHVMVPTCRAIIAPELKWLDYYRPPYYAPDFEDSIPIEGLGRHPFLPLIENSAAALRKLSLEPTGIQGEELLSCLRAPSYLRHLVMGQEPPYLRRKSRLPFPRPAAFPMTSLDLECLVVPPLAENPAGEGNDESQILLPYLEVFEAYQASGVTDEVLARFICNRLRRVSSKDQSQAAGSSRTSLTQAASWDISAHPPPLINGVAILRKVVLEFDRPKQFDITEQVQQAAKEAGVNFELELYYSPDIPSIHNPHSTSFGLSDDGRSWTFPDF